MLINRENLSTTPELIQDSKGQSVSLLHFIGLAIGFIQDLINIRSENQAQLDHANNNIPQIYKHLFELLRQTEIEPNRKIESIIDSVLHNELANFRSGHYNYSKCNATRKMEKLACILETIKKLLTPEIFEDIDTEISKTSINAADLSWFIRNNADREDFDESLKDFFAEQTVKTTQAQAAENTRQRQPQGTTQPFSLSMLVRHSVTFSQGQNINLKYKPVRENSSR